jgi:tagatose 6-phosphate kinase
MIACVGTTPVYQRSMLFERLQTNGVNRARRVWDYASGKAVNVARVLHTLGEDAVVSGFAGGDRGAAMRKDLDAAGIRHEFAVVDAPTRQCITTIDESAGTATELVEESHPVWGGDWEQLYARLGRLLPGAAAWVFSGSLPPDADPSFYLECLRRFEPSRPRVIVVDARGEPLRAALSAGGFVAKMNRDELAATVGRTLSTVEEVAQAMAGITPAGGAAVVTGGAEGAVASDGRGYWQIASPRVRAISAVGSGDAFTAGLAIGLLAGRSLADACAFAAACGAANAMTPLAGHLRVEDVRELEANVVVRPLAGGSSP